LTCDEIGYSAPTICRAGGTDQLIVWLDTEIYSLDPQSGQVHWRFAHPEDANPQRPVVNIIAPAWSNPWLLISEHYQGSLLLKLAADTPQAQVQWRSNRQRPTELNAMLASPVFIDDHVYGMTSSGVLRCFSAATGTVAWETLAVVGRRRQQFSGAYLVPHEDRCFIFNDQGDLIISRLSPDGFEEIDRSHLLEPLSYARGRNVAWSHPAFAHRCIFARNDQELICVPLGENS
jgi:outer membrane protein assembly factor BamB